jgi:hypothetical protein
MKIIITCFLLCSVVSGYCQTEAQLKAQLKKDLVFIKYDKARLDFITGVVENKWGNLTSDKEMLKKIKQQKSYNELRELYKKAGVDSGYLVALNKMIRTKAAVAKKYNAVIKSNPAMWKKVINELTSSIPKHPPLNLRSKR